MGISLLKKMTKEEIIEKYNIDINKLKRNYIKNPLKRLGRYAEKPPKEDLEYLYISCNILKEHLACFFGFKSAGQISKWLHCYNIKKQKELWKLSLKAGIVIKEQQDKNYQKKKLEKRIETCRKRYGVDNTFQSEDKKIKIKQTIFKKYGCDNPSKSDIVKKQKEQTWLKNYGVLNISNSEYYKNLYKNKDFLISKKEKEYQTKKKNNSFNKSNEEDIIYTKLLSKFGNIERQYKSEEYPFDCDFFIPELNLYIEYNGYWTHGNMIYDPKSQECKNILETWYQKSLEKNFKGKCKKSYSNAIEIWTIRDPLKRETAKKNNLNWIEFFTMEEFYNWYNKITLQA